MENFSKKKYRYIEIYESLFQKISEGTFPLGELLSSEKEIGKIYSVERTTVRKALEFLVNDGLVEKIQGVGTKVINQKKIITAHSNLKSSNTILFFLAKTKNNVDRLTQPYYSSLVFHLEGELKQHGYKINYSTISKNDNIGELLKQHTFAGIIFASYGVDRKHLDYVHEKKIPFITVNNDYANAVTISPDNFMGGYLVGKYLIDLGHRKIGLLKGKDIDASTILRLAGFKIALSEFDLQIEEKYVRTVNWIDEEAVIETRDILVQNKEDLPTALFAFNDEMALISMGVINEMGLKIPEDISVVGFDNIPQAEFFFPQLTTINCNIEMISKTAVWILHNKILNNFYDNFKITIPIDLIVRGSTRKI